MYEYILFTSRYIPWSFRTVLVTAKYSTNYNGRLWCWDAIVVCKL